MRARFRPGSEEGTVNGPSFIPVRNLSNYTLETGGEQRLRYILTYTKGAQKAASRWPANVLIEMKAYFPFTKTVTPAGYSRTHAAGHRSRSARGIFALCAHNSHFRIAPKTLCRRQTVMKDEKQNYENERTDMIDRNVHAGFCPSLQLNLTRPSL